MNKFFSNLGLALRAGKLVTGDDTVLDAIRSGKAKLAIMATDASDNTTKKFRDKCTSYHVPLMQYGTREELGASVGKAERVIMAVTDDGFAKLLRKCQANLAEVEKFE
ncbi:50S ribosomal protein L7ae [Paenibacillus sp. J31TS4]|uniref:L7Ae/L30e/S12e/Gadd45 family ribosomal protein n=1 Tax=Paenibacillus sp. J31TS4 TaxID=2807195 RepID=UPI001AFF7B01|nr:ribosomal L7Ae/L30e/S12e/Gadd45 family protein [Paenibacillus sp. J31TS4]GIP36855.1 50S ribosomal protein L7ae [Paenibacillus sp. J31TS4]